MKKYKLILFLVLLLSCKSTRKSGEFNDSINVTEISEGSEKFPKISITSNKPNSGFALAICDTKNNCSEKISPDKQIVLKGLKPDLYTATIHECMETPENTDCSKIINKIGLEQGEYSTQTAQNIFESQLKFENRLNELGVALYSAMKLHLIEINKCGAIPETDSSLKEYLTLIANILKQGPMTASDLLNSSYKSEFSQLETLTQNGLELAGENGSRSRVTLINYYYDKEAPSLFEPGSWKIDPHALVERIYGSKGMGHTALLIERYDPKTRKWVTSTYISWPIGNKLDVDAIKYADRKMAKMQLPEVSDSQLQKFHDWLKTTEFDPNPKDTRANELADL